jgi:DNA-binding NtrC family response regulator
MATKVLIVDDEPGLRTTLAANLELEGFEVAEAENGDDALRQLEAQPFDVVLTDIRMPGMSGVELFQVIKRRHPNVPVVLTTAFALEQAVREGMQEGAFAMLPKPSDVGHVVATLTRAAKRPLVLVVDDSDHTGGTTVSALEGIGLRAKAAHDTETALRLMMSGEVDVCVVDLAPPGPQLIDQIRQRVPQVAVIAVSVRDVPELIQRAAAAGAFACMRKPFAARELVKVVAEARGSRRGMRC